jgi:hypothetical protein
VTRMKAFTSTSYFIFNSDLIVVDPSPSVNEGT